MRLEQLRNMWRGQPVFLIGSGPSMRVFDSTILGHGAKLIALNQGWRYVPVSGEMALGLTAHPELVDEYRAAMAGPNPPAGGVGRWVVKRKGPLAQASLDDPRYYLFDTREDWGLFRRPEPDTLFLGRGIQQTAMHLAAYMGAACVLLVGVDMSVLGGDHHGHDQHVRYHGQDPQAVMAEYHAWTSRARDELAALGIPTYSLTPFVGVGRANDEYRHLRGKKGLAPLPAPRDTSGYNRPHVDLDPDRPHKRAK